MSALNLIYKDCMSFGIELPLDRDWSGAGQRLAHIDGRPFGVPDISNPTKGVELAEGFGFPHLHHALRSLQCLIPPVKVGTCRVWYTTNINVGFV